LAELEKKRRKKEKQLRRRKGRGEGKEEKQTQRLRREEETLKRKAKEKQRKASESRVSHNRDKGQPPPTHELPLAKRTKVTAEPSEEDLIKVDRRMRLSKRTTTAPCDVEDTTQVDNKRLANDNEEIDSNTCGMCFVSFEDVLEGGGAEWIPCSCGRWLHEDCPKLCGRQEW